MPEARQVFYLLDGHAIAYRQFHGLPIFSTQQGEPTNAVFGFSRTLMDIIQKDKPPYIAVSLDMGLSGRDQLYTEYKGTRDKMPDELESQITRIMQVIQAFNIPMLTAEGYEADDVIGTVSQQAVAQGVDVRIVTGDRDLLQLLNGHITAVLPQRKNKTQLEDRLWDADQFRQEYEFEPWQLVDYKALVGDTSDNIPGVKGIGGKTATQLIKDYGTLENIYIQIDDFKGALKTNLINGRESAFLSKSLAAIQHDVPVQLNLPACVTHEYDTAAVEALFIELEFRSLIDRLRSGSAPDTKSTKRRPSTPFVPGEQMTLFSMEDEVEAAPIESIVETIIVDDEDKLAQLVAAMQTADAITFDVESTSTDRMLADLVGIALAVNGDRGYYIPVGHNDGQQLPMQYVLDAIRGPLTDLNIPKYAHNASYDLVVMQRYGIDVAPITFDTMIATWLCDQNAPMGLKSLAYYMLGVEMTEIKELIGTGKKQITMDAVPITHAAPYAAADAVITHRLVEKLQPKLEQSNLVTLFQTLEMPLVPVIAAMEKYGVELDAPFLGVMGVRLGERMAQIEAQIQETAENPKLNLNSPAQLSDLLFGKLGLPTQGISRTQLGYSTAAHVLESLRDAHPVVDLILQYRELSKLKGTYVDALPQLVHPDTGRVHTDFNQAGSATGRVSSSNPNLQNIPIRNELVREVRRAFVAPQGKRLLSIDYSQIELRIMAHVSNEPTLIEAFERGQDIHATTAAVVNNVPLESVTKEQRIFAKRVNFGILYGMGAFRLARDSNLTHAEAKAFIDEYFRRLPNVERYLDETIKKAETLGYVETLFGRRRNFDILKKNPNSRRPEVETAKREAINMPIQGTAADIMKRAMIDIYNALQQRSMNAKMILQVHDELVFEVPEDEVQQTRDLVINIMESAKVMENGVECELRVPLQANAQVGMNWLDMQPI